MSNPFDDDVDISSFYKPNKTELTKKSPVSEDFDFYQQQIEQILQSSVESSNRGVLKLEETEQIGIATAGDLVNQGEKIRKVDHQLDDINSTTKQSQKHINNIKSWFGGTFKNMFSKPEPQNVQPKLEEPTGPNKLSSTVEKLNTQADHYYSNASSTGQSSLSEPSRAALAGTKWEVMNNQVDENLDSMSANLRRLCSLGTAMGQEIDDQNAMLDKITVKADKADVEIRKQDKQMKKILGGGKSKQKSQDSEENQPPSILGKKK